MNYLRIYDEFIADRLAKQPSDDKYFEIHHIKPRCMGGDDMPKNLVRLSAGDHLFAHQLLARIYDKTEYSHQLWGAVLVLCRDILRGTRNGQRGKRLGSLSVMGARGLRLRKSLDIARSKGVENRSGENSPAHDPTIYQFRNDDGRQFDGTRSAFCEEYGLSSGTIPRLLKDETNKTSDGWRIFDSNKGENDRRLERDQEKYTFVAGCSGAKKKATRAAFKKYTNIPWPIVHAIVDHGFEYGSWRRV